MVGDSVGSQFIS